MLKFETLTRLISAADFGTFRDAAALYLRLRGFKDVNITDGWKDGGSDVRVCIQPPNTTSMAIQVSVEKNWKTKLMEDALKAKKKLKLTRFLFISSRRIPNAEVEPVAEELLRDHDIFVMHADCQSLASKFVESADVEDVANLFGLDVVVSDTDFDPTALIREEAISAFTFFSPETSNFRKEVVDTAVLSATRVLGNNVTREKLVPAVVAGLSLKDTQSNLVESAVDRVVQRGDLVKTPGLSVAPHIEATLELADATFKKSKEALESTIEDILAKNGAVIPKSPELRDAIVNGIGALIIGTATAASDSLTRSIHHTDFQKHIKDKIRALHSTLDTFGVPQGTERNRVLELIIAVAEKSVFGRALMCGELFLHLISQSPSQLFLALNGRTGASVMLDASVAIPFLCCSLFEKTYTKFFSSSYHAVTDSQRVGCEVILPIDYLSEVDGHLHLAYERYKDLIGTDDDLAYSENAFVAYYIQIRQKNTDLDFAEYLRLLGFNVNTYRKGVHYINKMLRPTFERLGVKVESLGHAPRQARIDAERELTFLLKEHGYERHKLTVDHDVRTLAFLRTAVFPKDKQILFCTWDSIHLKVYETTKEAGWTTISPSVLSDLITLASRGQNEINTPSVLASYIHGETARNGAKILDTLARIEKGGLHTAKLIDQARRFKEKYLGRTDYQLDTRSISSAWENWKREH